MGNCALLSHDLKSFHLEKKKKKRSIFEYNGKNEYYDVYNGKKEERSRSTRAKETRA